MGVFDENNINTVLESSLKDIENNIRVFISLYTGDTLKVQYSNELKICGHYVSFENKRATTYIQSLYNTTTKKQEYYAVSLLDLEWNNKLKMYELVILNPKYPVFLSHVSEIPFYINFTTKRAVSNIVFLQNHCSYKSDIKDNCILKSNKTIINCININNYDPF